MAGISMVSLLASLVLIAGASDPLSSAGLALLTIPIGAVLGDQLARRTRGSLTIWLSASVPIVLYLSFRFQGFDGALVGLAALTAATTCGWGLRLTWPEFAPSRRLANSAPVARISEVEGVAEIVRSVLSADREGYRAALETTELTGRQLALVLGSVYGMLVDLHGGVRRSDDPAHAVVTRDIDRYMFAIRMTARFGFFRWTLSLSSVEKPQRITRRVSDEIRTIIPSLILQWRSLQAPFPADVTAPPRWLFNLIASELTVAQERDPHQKRMGPLEEATLDLWVSNWLMDTASSQA
jgi:hypothetical protein